jgi:4-nitrophenyl phosphatase
VILDASQIVTSSDATADVLASAYPARGRVFVVGENGILSALAERGFTAVSDPADAGPVKAVVAGIDRGLSYQKLRRATLHIRAGAAFYGTNGDRTFPTPEGLVPGAGSILAALAAATDVTPTVIGKPAPFMLEMAAERVGLSEAEVLVVGDRLETDIAGGQAMRARTALVLSGVSTREQAAAWKPAPDLIAADLAALVK